MHASLRVLVAVTAIFTLSACKPEDALSQAAESSPQVALVRAPMSPLAAERGIPQLDPGDAQHRHIELRHTVTIEVPVIELAKKHAADIASCRALGCEVVETALTIRQTDAFAALEARLPPNEVDRYLEGLAQGPGAIVDHQAHGTDRTLEVIDVRGRLMARQALRDRLVRLLSETPAMKIEDILRVEQELTRVQGEIETAEASLRHLSTLTRMVAVAVRYQLPPSDTLVDTTGIESLWQRAGSTLLSSIGSTVLVLAALLPWIAIGLPTVFFIQALRRLSRRKVAAKTSDPA